ncbi:hypothetical protein GSI_04564 [Ganoderma sinense ZZ0214-1]|uniref:Uncharacterized protein n=1 Tax=Ganoderma sinense ZZ0214-1 TaxID=1077348 RepID=A0A2G8SH55_9APHY|nr:hypothetical protein GSI_04564 [Ganoderma sinense ZZ0214-1]
MAWSTVFSFDSATFSTTDGLTLPTQTQVDNWSSAKVSVHDLGASGRWLMIELGNAAPTVFRAITEAWKVSVSCDEDTMTVTMHGADAGALTRTTQKLRFNQAKEFWMFVSHIAVARAQEYAGVSAGASVEGVSASL